MKRRGFIKTFAFGLPALFLLPRLNQPATELNELTIETMDKWLEEPLDMPVNKSWDNIVDEWEEYHGPSGMVYKIKSSQFPHLYDPEFMPRGEI